MTTVIDATFDGEVFRPAQPVQIEPNTQVRLRVESSPPASENSPALNGEQDDLPPKLGEPYSSLKFLASLKLDGPPDWSANIDKYLYPDTHGKSDDDAG